MLGCKIREYLIENGIKQAYISEKTGISPNILSAMLNGNRRILAVEYFKICAALNVQLDFFANQITA